jgi:high affinity Mn2+ porin
MKKISLLICLLASSKLFAQTAVDSFPEEQGWSTHFQMTIVSQSHPAFHAAYNGINSLSDSAEQNVISLTSTIFVGRKLWKGAAFYFNPEMAGGKGLSGARGIAGFPNGETFRIGDPALTLYTGRAYLQQVIPLKNTSYQYMGDDVNQVAEIIPTSRLCISAGKFAVSDFFDDNKFSHDPRTQFLNWSLMSNGAWDYPANTRGYTVGIVVELIKPTWAVRIGSVQEPKTANGPTMDPEIFKAHSETIEFEKSLSIKNQPGTIRLLAFHNLTQAPSYRAAIDSAASGDSSFLPVFTGNYEWKKYGGLKYGFGLNVEQNLSDNAGVFLRAGWNDGKTATWAFTEIDESFSIGVNIQGKHAWEREKDNAGAAFVMNGISKDHQDFLKAGLYGFIIGDGKLLNYGAEDILELYYRRQLFSNIFVTGDYQFVNHPAYNKDRGPVNIFSVRCHVEF